jgi:uncharacterized membrane protein YdbT with pleckstrin-like domain
MASNLEPHGYLKKVLSPGETVLFRVRQHSIFLFGRIFVWLVLSLVIVGVVGALWTMNQATPLLYGLGLLIVPLFVIWWQYLQWTNHGYVLTNRRVIQLNGVFSKEVIDSLLEKLNDIKTDQTLLGRMFGYGDVEILTANEVGNNIFRHIAHPLEFKTAMLQAKEALERTGVR